MRGGCSAEQRGEPRDHEYACAQLESKPQDHKARSEQDEHERPNVTGARGACELRQREQQRRTDCRVKDAWNCHPHDHDIYPRSSGSNYGKHNQMSQ